MRLQAKRHFFTGCGIVFVAMGVIALFIPLLPTTPFLILGAMCFSKGSEKFHSWLLTHAHLGPPIVDWQTHGVIRTQHKILATVMMSGSCYFILSRPSIPDVAKATFVAFIAAVLLFVWTRKGRR